MQITELYFAIYVLILMEAFLFAFQLSLYCALQKQSSIDPPYNLQENNLRPHFIAHRNWEITPKMLMYNPSSLEEAYCHRSRFLEDCQILNRITFSDDENDLKALKTLLDIVNGVKIFTRWREWISYFARSFP